MLNLLLSTLIEEAHQSKSCKLRLKDDLQTMKKSDKGVPKFSCDFKAICNQLVAMGRPVDDLKKLHWYLHGLSSSFSTFSTTQLPLSPFPIFDECYEIFVRSLESTPPSGSTIVAFTTFHSFKPGSNLGGHGEGRSSGGCGRGGRNN